MRILHSIGGQILSMSFVCVLMVICIGNGGIIFLLLCCAFLSLSWMIYALSKQCKRKCFIQTISIIIVNTILLCGTFWYMIQIDAAKGSFKFINSVGLKEDSKQLGLFICDYDVAKPLVLNGDTIKSWYWVQYANKYANYVTNNHINVEPSAYNYMHQVDNFLEGYHIQSKGHKFTVYDEHGNHFYTTCLWSDEFNVDSIKTFYLVRDEDRQICDSMVYRRTSAPIFMITTTEPFEIVRPRTVLERIADLFFFDDVSRYILSNSK